MKKMRLFACLIDCLIARGQKNILQQETQWRIYIRIHMLSIYNMTIYHPTHGAPPPTVSTNQVSPW